ncbi:expressed unknown protein [Seminavis robusta]|uniref:Uncharacterized protein n=1 Tax=Seminavis robusta TaxID=568900 RepID=A0A9N8DC01_9STRA|nr:expressed unknown protein [Seminavis robusta]|eukprot:Sro29_g019270.1 n/a (157) ;mRNA; r:129263-129733
MQFFKKSWYLLFMLLALGVKSTLGAFGVAPPIGAKYEKSVGIPVLGKQVFSLQILSDSTAHLVVRGMLILDEIVPYKVTSRGRLNCSLSDKALQCLRKVRASLQEVGYDSVTDTPYVKVRTPLPAAVKIHLKRQNAAEVSDEEKILNIKEEAFSSC